MTFRSFGELAETLSKVRERLQNEAPNLVVAYAKDLTALIEERITTTGTGVTGTPLKDYTPRYKTFKQAPQLTKRGKQLGLGSSRYTGRVDYTLTGGLWADIGVKDVKESDGRISVLVSAKKPINLKILESLKKRDGDPLSASDKEQEIAKENFKAGLMEILAPLT